MTSQSNGSSEFFRHDACPNCGSSDGLAVYDGPHFCFVCHNWTGTSSQSYVVMTSTHYQGHATRLAKRGISEKTCERFKIYKDGNHVEVSLPQQRWSACRIKGTGPLIRTSAMKGRQTVAFFGQHLWRSSGKRIIITEGELDAASYSELYPTWPVVSLPNGAAAAKKSLQKNLEFLQGYDEVVLWFDNDEAGTEAAKSAAGVLPPGKAFIARLEAYKDLSDALQDNNLKAIDDAFFHRTEYRPDGIVEGKSLLEVITKPNPPNDYDYPFQGLQRLLHGIRRGELVTITAGSGTGKSSFCRELAASLLQKGERVGYLALEESVRRTTLGLDVRCS